MRILTVCVALLLMAATAEAQGRGGGGFHGGGGGFGAPRLRGNPGFGSHLRPGFNPGGRTGFNRGFGRGFDRGFGFGFGGFDNQFVLSPFFGFPFFSTGFDPLYSGPIFSAPATITPDQNTRAIGDQTNEVLRSQVSQLTTEVQQLQAELAAVRGQSTPASTGAPNAPAVTLILKDGRRIEAAGYALVGSTLWILNAQDATKISVSEVDVDATQKENQRRGINVVIPPNTSQWRVR